MRWWRMAVAAATMLAATVAHGADPVKIRLAWTVPVANWGAMLLEKKDLAQHFGKSYVLQPVHYTASSTQITARESRASARPLAVSLPVLNANVPLSTTNQIGATSGRPSDAV